MIVVRIKDIRPYNPDFCSILWTNGYIILEKVLVKTERIRYQMEMTINDSVGFVDIVRNAALKG